MRKVRRSRNYGSVTRPCRAHDPQPGWPLSVARTLANHGVRRGKLEWQAVYLGERFRLMTPQDHRIFWWTPPKAHDFVGFRAVLAHFHGVIHKFIDGICRRVIKVAL
jgi:hypothetical protein